ncbi:MAG: hypothetical protein L6Q33_02530 [Bacteriovoracaceae bacterium]|jgi:hypothetical protein|nr:hypothetical protein [Bacteriovoracaceae bacterium]
MKCLFLYCVLFLSGKVLAIESLDGFLVEGYDDRFRVISPQKFKAKMEVIVENKTLVKLVGRLHLNNAPKPIFYTIQPGSYEKKIIDIKKGDILHFVPLSPPFQEVELIIGNKIYEIPPKK